MFNEREEKYIIILLHIMFHTVRSDVLNAKKFFSYSKRLKCKKIIFMFKTT